MLNKTIYYINLSMNDAEDKDYFYNTLEEVLAERTKIREHLDFRDYAIFVVHLQDFSNTEGQYKRILLEHSLNLK